MLETNKNKQSQFRNADEEVLPSFTFIRSKESEISFVVPSFWFEFTTSLT